MRALYSHSREYRKNIFEQVFPEYFDKTFGEFAWCEYMPRLYSHPREYRKIVLANYLCIGFVPGVIRAAAQMMADEFHFLLWEIQNYIAEAGADLIPVPGQ